MILEFVVVFNLIGESGSDLVNLGLTKSSERTLQVGSQFFLYSCNESPAMASLTLERIYDGSVDGAVVFGHGWSKENKRRKKFSEQKKSGTVGTQVRVTFQRL